MAVRFHIPDFLRFYHLNQILLTMLETYPERFRDGVEIASVYGAFPASLWNGGRMMPGSCDAKTVRTVIEGFNQKKIPLRFTFTNPMLTEAHLDDAFCNRCMKLANNGLNEVIVVSPLLEAYIRKQYPHYKITSSTCKQISQMDALCAELEKDYHYVVLDYNWNNRFDVLETIPHKEKCELLINPVCVPQCPRRGEHYRTLGLSQIAYCAHLQQHPGQPFQDPHPFKCPHVSKSLYATNHTATHITPDDLYEKYVPMGFSEFKIEGRSAKLFNVMETYLYYMAKPECRDELRLIFLLSLQSNGVVDVLND